MIGLALKGCVHEKRVKVSNKYHFTTSCIWYVLIFCILSYYLYFLYFQLLAKMLNFIIIKVTWKLGYQGD